MDSSRDVETRLLPQGNGDIGGGRDREEGEEPSTTSYGSLASVRVRIARIGELPHGGGAKLSRDGSVHVTDEVFNTASHFVGAMLSVLGLAELVTKASQQGQPWKIVGFSIYGASLVALFACSTLHHGLEGPAAMERGLRIADFAAIYPLIAGTFTPPCLVFLHSTGFGWVLLGTVWFLAGCGIAIIVSAFDHLPKWLPMTMFLTMGWMGALLALAIFKYVGVGGIALLAAGGVAYSAGGVVYHGESPNPVPGRFGFHEIWHVMVLLGALLHFLFMWLYIVPYVPA